MSFSVILFLMVIAGSFFTSCQDDGDSIELTKEYVTGTWDVTWIEQEGAHIDVPDGYVSMTVKWDGTYRVKMFLESYVGQWSISGNKLVGITRDPITEVFRFTSLDGDKAEISYSNSEGMKMKFKAKKR